jgi:hypothetical protein
MEVEKVVRSNGESATKILDTMMSNALNKITTNVNKVLFPYGLQKPFPKNCLSLMTQSGAKGGLVSFSSVSAEFILCFTLNFNENCNVKRHTNCNFNLSGCLN